MIRHVMIAAGMAVAIGAAGPALAQHVTRQQASAPRASDQTFVKEAIQGNLAEVQLGQLAEQKGSSPQVKQLGQMLQTDHQANNQKAESLAQTLNVTPPTAPNAAQKRTYDRLSKLSGAEFDRQFVTSTVADHRKDIAKFSKEAKSSNQQVAQYANATLPDLKKHLQAAETAEKSSKASGRSSGTTGGAGTTH